MSEMSCGAVFIQLRRHCRAAASRAPQAGCKRTHISFRAQLAQYLGGPSTLSFRTPQERAASTMPRIEDWLPVHTLSPPASVTQDANENANAMASEERTSAPFASASGVRNGWKADIGAASIDRCSSLKTSATLNGWVSMAQETKLSPSSSVFQMFLGTRHPTKRLALAGRLAGGAINWSSLRLQQFLGESCTGRLHLTSARAA